ncbi:MAG: hypothetical protein AABY02_01980, partial [Nanoarchaeota archaeon]
MESEVKKEREMYLGRIFLAFIISTAVFVMFFVFAYSVSYLNYQKLSKQANVLDNSIKELGGAFENFSCDGRMLIKASETFDDAAQKLNLLEKRFGKSDERVLELKKRYSELEYRHFKITKKFNEECGSGYVIVFFFYSNRDQGKEDESERMGYILTAFEREDADKIMIYALDFDLKTALIDSLKGEYNITRPPMIVVNEKDVFYVRNLRELEK